MVLVLVSRLRETVVSATTSLFSHGRDPLSDTLSYSGDPGLFGPGSVTWPVLGDVSAFVGGIRALLIQAAQPEVAAGVSQHSRYRDDPLGRLSRTSAYVTAVSFGAQPEVDAAVAMVARRHRSVSGISERGVEYDAAMSGLAAWVHNSLTDSFLVAYRLFGAEPLNQFEADRFVAEQSVVGQMLGASPLPLTSSELSSWLTENSGTELSAEQLEALEFLKRPPLDPLIVLAYGFLYRAAVASIPDDLRRHLGLQRQPGALLLGRLSISVLRWLLGSSPSWSLALERVGRPPDGRFRQGRPETSGRASKASRLDRKEAGVAL